jgi:ferric-dicitrate binding protein FerR (iron transport regulator)
MTGSEDPNADAGESALEQTLVRHLATRPLDAQALLRVHAAVQDAWEATLRPAAPRGARKVLRHRGSWAAVALAACVVAAVIGLAVLARPAADGEMIGTLARTHDGTLEVGGRLFRHRALAVGDAVRVGDRFTAGGAALIRLTGGGTLRVAAGTVIGVKSVSQLRLEHGTLYVDKPAGLPAGGRLGVLTRAGLVEHVGTEFEVLSDDQTVRIRVREGQVRFAGPDGVQFAVAGTELVAASDGQVTREPVPTYGPDWQWAAALAPEFAVEGRSLDDYLQWLSRELGRPVVFADGRARESARRTILHGSVRSPATLDALAQVLSSTSLTYELADGVIRVHSGP